MLALNIMTPLYNEDYAAHFVWPMGVPNLGELPDNTSRVSSVLDVFKGLRVYYLTGGGRIPGALIGGLFTFWGKMIFNPFNALMFLLLILEIYWLSHKGTITTNVNAHSIIWIFFCLWSFNGPFIDTYLWMSGATDYLWMLVIGLAFLLPYVKNFYQTNLYNLPDKKRAFGMFLLGIVAGCSHETTVCWVILILCYWLHVCYKEKMLQPWKVSGFIGLCIGYAILGLAPGNFTRLGEKQYYISSNDRMSELIIILFLHSILWYFVFKFSKACRKRIISGSIAGQLKLAKASLLIAVSSTVFNVMLPVSGWRPSFLSLTFLIITFFILNNVQNEANIRIIPKNAKVLLKTVASVYLFLSIVCSLYGGYNTYRYWNNSIGQIKMEQSLHPDHVVNIKRKISQPYENSTLWKCLTMYKVIFPPVISDNEQDRINRIVARYYGVKGIRVVQHE